MIVIGFLPIHIKRGDCQSSDFQSPFYHLDQAKRAERSATSKLLTNVVIVAAPAVARNHLTYETSAEKHHSDNQHGKS